MKIYFCKNLFRLRLLAVFFISLISLNGDFINAEYVEEDFQFDTTTKSKEESSVIPTNPFEIVEMIRRYNSMNDATNPSDALDDALKLFNSSEEKQEI